MESWLGRTRAKACAAVAWLCAALMLCVVPLAFHNGFFDINRIKVMLVCRAVPLLLAAFAVTVPLRRDGLRALKPPKEALAPILCLALLLCALVISSARTGFDEATLLGNEGRYCGLYFWLSCGAAFLMIALGGASLKHVEMAAALCAGAVAALGIANALGLDPLGFYRGIREDQRSVFYSTIGNADFFGAYLAMLFPLSGARFVRGSRGRYAGFALSLLLACGVIVSRTDSSFLALHVSCAALVCCSGSGLRALSRALVLWGGCFFALPVLRPALAAADRQLYGLLLALCQSGAVLALGGLCLCGALACRFAEKKGKPAPGRKPAAVLVAAAAAIAAALIGAIVYFTCVEPTRELGASSALLRFDDDWGSRRGFVYTRSMIAYGDYGAADRLLGKGPDLTKRILAPYADNARVLSMGTFNDAHCQPLQLLLTCGLLGCLSFLALYISMLRALFLLEGKDPLLCGLIASLTGYAVIMLLQVTQPILISTFLSLCALALSRIRQLKEGLADEP